MEHKRVEELLQFAKSLTGSNDMNVLVRAARQIGDWMSAEKPSTDSEPVVWLPPHDLLSFMKQTKITDQHGVTSTFKPYMWQRHAAEMIDAFDVVLIAGSRRMGVTDLISRTLAYELTKPNSRSMLMSHKQAHSRETAARSAQIIRGLPPQSPQVTNNAQNIIEVGYSTSYASALYCRNMDAIGLKGHSLTMLVVEHGDFMPYSKVNDFLSCAMPLMAACRSKLIITGNNPSDPKSLLGKLWQSPMQAARITVPWSNIHADENPHHTGGVDESRANMSPDAFKREYGCGIGLTTLEEPLMSQKR